MSYRPDDHRSISLWSRRLPRRRMVRAAPAEAEQSSSSQQASLNAGAPPVPLAAPTVGGWLARIVGRKSELVLRRHLPPCQRIKRPARRFPAPRTMPMNTIGLDFLVPIVTLPVLSRCSGGHLSCDGTAEVRNGRRFHQCFCGNAAFISETPMKTLESTRLSVDRDEFSPKPPVSRPPTAKQQISRCDPSTPDTWHSGEVVSVASACPADNLTQPAAASAQQEMNGWFSAQHSARSGSALLVPQRAATRPFPPLTPYPRGLSVAGDVLLGQRMQD